MAQTEIMITQAQVDSARAEGLAEGQRLGREQGTAAALERFRAILTCEAAADRLPHAVVLALGKTATEDALALLPNLPAGKPAAPPPLAERTQSNPLAPDQTSTRSSKVEIADAWQRSMSRNGAHYQH